LPTDESRWYVGGPDKKAYGPYGFSRLRDYVKAGKVKPDSFLLEEGSTEWVRAASVPGLFMEPLPALEPPPPPSPSPVPVQPTASPSTPVKPFVRTRFAYTLVAVAFLACSLYQCSGVGERSTSGAAANFIRVWDPFTAGLLLLNAAILIQVLGILEKRDR
jgi:hypothetical protein